MPCAWATAGLSTDVTDLFRMTSCGGLGEGRNLSNVPSLDAARNVELHDMSRRAVVEGLARPGRAEPSPQVLNLMPFDRLVGASDLGGMIVLDRDGSVVGGSEPGRLGTDLSDREYFRTGGWTSGAVCTSAARSGGARQARTR